MGNFFLKSNCNYKHNTRNMDEFFLDTLTKLNTGNYNDLTIVIGNESCDLDSAISSLVYAVFLNWQYNKIKCKVCTKDKRPSTVKDDIFVPIFNVDRSDYALKTEVAYLLRSNKIYDSNLVFRDDHDLLELMNKSVFKVVLVDHHSLAKRDQCLAPAVIEVIDHRPLDKPQWCYKEDTRSTIETVGSCCTLVAQRIKDLSKLFATDVDFFNDYPVCSKLLHATIVLDTVNFSKEVAKGTPHDEEIIQFLESVIKPSNYNSERVKVLQTLLAARSDVSALTAAQLLRKDVKIVGTMLVPSFPLLVKDFLKKPEAIKSVNEALQRQGCNLALLLGMDLSNGLQRDVAVYSGTNTDAAVTFSKYLEEWSRPTLGLTPQILRSARDFCYYTQSNLTASRKQYIPAVTEYSNNK